MTMHASFEENIFRTCFKQDRAWDLNWENTKIFHLLDFLRLDRICICFQLLTKTTFYNRHECLWISVLYVFLMRSIAFNPQLIFLSFVCPLSMLLMTQWLPLSSALSWSNLKTTHGFLAVWLLRFDYWATDYCNQSVSSFPKTTIAVTSSFEVQ